MKHLLLLLVLFAPLHAFASSETLVCGDFTLSGNASCSGDDIVLSSGAFAWAQYFPAFEPRYWTFTYTGTLSIGLMNDGFGIIAQVSQDSYSDYDIGAGTSDAVGWYRDTQAGRNGVGTVSGICVTDTPGECGGGGGGSGQWCATDILSTSTNRCAVVGLDDCGNLVCMLTATSAAQVASSTSFMATSAFIGLAFIIGLLAIAIAVWIWTLLVLNSLLFGVMFMFFVLSGFAIIAKLLRWIVPK